MSSVDCGTATEENAVHAEDSFLHMSCQQEQHVSSVSQQCRSVWDDVEAATKRLLENMR